MKRFLRWMQEWLPFIQNDAYSDYDDRMDAYLANATGPPAERENWMSAAMKERGPDTRRGKPQ